MTKRMQPREFIGSGTFGNQTPTAYSMHPDLNDAIRKFQVTLDVAGYSLRHVVDGLSVPGAVFQRDGSGTNDFVLVHTRKLSLTPEVARTVGVLHAVGAEEKLFRWHCNNYLTTQQQAHAIQQGTVELGGDIYSTLTTASSELLRKAFPRYT